MRRADHDLPRAILYKGRMSPLRRARSLSLAPALGSLALLGALCSMASAQGTATVRVELKDKAGHAADGEVSLHNKSGERVAGCTTAQGRCEMVGVTGGLYEVRVKPASGAPAPKPRTAMIPSEGTATLIVSTGS